MKRMFKGLAIFITGLFCGAHGRTEDKMAVSNQSIYDFKVKSIDGKEVSLGEYKGKVLLIVNTASHCGFTSQYKALEEIYEKYKDKGLAVLGFPSNDYGGQEPGTNAEIQTFCSTKFSVKFPMFEKGPVSGKEIQPLFKFLTETANPKFDGKIRWNFEKFIIDRNGKLIERFRSVTSPDSGRLVKILEQALAENKK